MKKSVLALTTALSLFAVTPALADDVSGADPACIMKNADGTESIDKVKCPDGKTMGAAAAPKTDQTATTAPATTTERVIIVPAEQLNGATLMTASDYIGKRVYDTTGADIGEVNDIILTGDGKVQATILGVGGFLGIGEKDVAVPVGSVDVVKDGNSVKLVVNATKEQLEAAPSYDRNNRRYAS